MKFLTTVIKIFGVTKLKIDKIKFVDNSNITFIDIIPLYKNIFLDKIKLIEVSHVIENSFFNNNSMKSYSNSLIQI